MNISDMWLEVCGDKDFANLVSNAIDLHDIPMEEWCLIDVPYKELLITLDVFHDFETDSYMVYPTFMYFTLFDQDPMIVRLKND